MSYDYTVFSPDGAPILHTAVENLRYPPPVEAQMLSLGYKITINGRRLTKKEAADKMKKSPASGTGNKRRR